MSGPLIHHAHRPIGNADILGVIVDICKEEKAYGTILLVALMSKLHHAVVQPYLTRIKNRVVLDLDDFAWRDKENDGNIEIIICSGKSTRPVELGSRQIYPQLEARLHPAILVFRGRPGAEAFKLWARIFPNTAIIVFSEDTRLQLDDVMEGSDFPGTLAKKSVDRFYKLYGDALSDEELRFRDYTIRYRLHQAHQQLQLDCPGQRLYQVRFSDPDSSHVHLESDVWLYDPLFQQENIVDECIAMLPAQVVCYNDVTLTCYVQLATIAPGTFFSRRIDSSGAIPSGFLGLSNKLERLTSDILEGADSRFTFRLFILNHGDRWADRDEMEPMYSTTTFLASDDPKIPGVIKRDYDEDFARCIVNGGCRRCRS